MHGIVLAVCIVLLVVSYLCVIENRLRKWKRKNVNSLPFHPIHSIPFLHIYQYQGKPTGIDILVPRHIDIGLQCLHALLLLQTCSNSSVCAHSFTHSVLHSTVSNQSIIIMSGLPMQWIAVGVGFCYLLQSGSISPRTVGVSLLALISGGLYLLYKYQEHLLYQPRIFPQHITPKDNPPGMRSPNEHGLPFEDIYLTTPDSIQLHAWFIRPEDKIQRMQRPTILFFHENAGNMGLRMDNLRMMYSQLECNVVILSYRGYGESQGIPSEDGLYIDAETTLQWLLTREDIDRSRIVVFGRSLGGAVAIDLASKHEGGESALPGNIAALIVENTFASISSMVDVVFPYLAVAKRFILRMKWESIEKIPTISKPILFISGSMVS
jgi:fermentation-respiration switch protein FrsA (DUF1100 family)